MIPDHVASPEEHFRFPPGPHLWEVCGRCNFRLHLCHFCGQDLRHDEHNFDGTPHGCYVDADAHFDEIDAGYNLHGTSERDVP
jgi:hypothetical protein